MLQSCKICKIHIVASLTNPVVPEYLTALSLVKIDLRDPSNAFCMKDITIRRAVYEDLPVLFEFEQGVIAAERPFDETLAADPIHYYDLEAMLAAPEVALLVAESEGMLIGSGYARIEKAKPYLRHINHAYLGFMYVLPVFRGKGVNRLILEELVAWAYGQDVKEIRLDVYNRNEPAIRAYEKAGFTAHLVEMRRAD